MGMGQIDIDPMVAGIITLGFITARTLPKLSAALIWRYRKDT